MHRSLTILVILFLFTGIDELSAQKRKKFKMNPAFRGRYKNISVPKSKMNTICPGYIGSAYPYHGIGIKLGDPFAITYKAYLSENVALAMDVGRVSSGLYNSFHKGNFQSELMPDTLTNGSIIRYFGHQAKTDGVFALKLLYSSELSKITALKVYLGAGIQYRWSNIYYTFIREIPNENSELGRYIFETTTSGFAGTFGIEYAHPSMPISSFFEFESYFDTTKFPNWIRLSGGVGLRYTF